MKTTAAQGILLLNIAAGYPDPTSTGDDEPRLHVVTHQWSRDGDAIVAHRTVVRAGATGDPRTDYRTELDRIQRDGALARL